jgi:predicted transglutaminase-like cysteine proteinase
LIAQLLFDEHRCHAGRACSELTSLYSKLLLAILLILSLLSGCASKPAAIKQPPQASVSTETVKLQDPDFKQLIASIEKEHGPVAANRIRYWAKLIKKGKHLAEIEKLQQTNRFFNGARFVTDEEIWQQKDYWATPVEFLIEDAGDCEDFSIAKYFTLRLMGVEDNKMRLNYVKALTLNKPHMVLSYYTNPSAVPLILDNINPQILPGNQRQDLVPVYSFNGTTLWLARTRNEQQKVGNTESVPLWSALRVKVGHELNISIPN